MLKKILNWTYETHSKRRFKTAISLQNFWIVFLQNVLAKKNIQTHNRGTFATVSFKIGAAKIVQTIWALSESINTGR